MPYNGLEIEMFGVGAADCILVTRWTNSVAVRVLVDGAHAGDTDTILGKLRARGVTHLDHVVCSHPHDDHAAGLVGIVRSPALTIGQLWMHLPWAHINLPGLLGSLNQTDGLRIVRVVKASLTTAQQLFQAAQDRRIPVGEPFDGTWIGPLYVCGPTVAYYTSLLTGFADFARLYEYEEAFAAHDRLLLRESFLAGGAVSIGGQVVAESEGELGAEPTEPENNASAILWAKQDTDQILLTADAGVPALEAAKSRHDLSNLAWMQIPHHGSRRNLTQGLVEYFRPAIAFVSADGSRHHPRRKVVNAFKGQGTRVFSTHHPNVADLRQWFGDVPARAGDVAATPL